MENVKQDTNIGTNILRVSASDEDADNNGAIRYSLTAPGDPSDLDYFDIQPESGWIFLTKPLDVSSLFSKITLSPNVKITLHYITTFFMIHITTILEEFWSEFLLEYIFGQRIFERPWKYWKKMRRIFVMLFFFWCFFTIYYHIISWDRYRILVISPLTSGPNTNQKQFLRDRTKIVKRCFEKCNDIFREFDLHGQWFGKLVVFLNDLSLKKAT